MSRASALMLLLSLLLATAQAQTTNNATDFTYQGHLELDGSPVDGVCDFEVGLFGALSGPPQIGSTVPFDDVTVADGLFTLQLDFGAGAFDGDDRWLQIAVNDCADGTEFTALLPRQPLTPAPYAIHANDVDWDDVANKPAGFADGIDDGTAHTAGAGLTLTGTEFSVTTNAFWSTGGNAGTTPGTHFVGTTDDQALELKVNGVRALRLEPNEHGSPNVLGGSASNTLTAGVGGAAIAGGGHESVPNSVTDSFGTVGGGYGNRAGDDDVGNATNTSEGATVGGGLRNVAGGTGATVGGGRDNETKAENGTIAGGFSNLVTDSNGIIGGGSNNQAGDDTGTSEDAPGATVAGGQDNVAGGGAATVGGGSGNAVSAGGGTIAGGSSNKVTDQHGTVGGGNDNQAGDDAGDSTDKAAATVSGGQENVASGAFSTVGGGRENIAGGEESTVGGGVSNDATGLRSVVSGGESNGASGLRSSIGGGQNNQATGEKSTVAGGFNNDASMKGATVGGGEENNADGEYSTVGGGFGNIASGDRSVVPGGEGNQATAADTFAAGFRAVATNAGSFVWADASTGDSFSSSADNQFNVRAVGGVRIYTATDLSNGATLDAGGGAWNTFSDRNVKERFARVAPREVLERVARLPIASWEYIGTDWRHMGPMAQDFYAAFGLGSSERTINTVDADGVALAAIQGVYEVVQEKDARIDALNRQLTLMTIVSLASLGGLALGGVALVVLFRRSAAALAAAKSVAA